MNLPDKSLCTGCHACYTACPVNSITMQEDEEGFRYPVIDTATCTVCGICEQICPVLNLEAK
jgi:formate hydrogenlyase subunit 6/NADH:ubiquinone oxidoreductase subunit I